MYRFPATANLLHTVSFTTRRSCLIPTKSFSTITALNMPEQLKESEVKKGDPTVLKQFDDETPSEEKFQDFYQIADNLKISLMGTLRDGVGVRGSSI